MKFKILVSRHSEKVFKIEEDFPEVGAYLYVFEKGECIKDYLQDNIDLCKEFAFEEFNVPLDSWKIQE